MHDEPWLTPAQVAARLQVSLDTVLRQLRTGALPGGRIGRQWRIRPADLETYLLHGAATADRAVPTGEMTSPVRRQTR
jgi:excisionase family DNA binding protein